MHDKRSAAADWDNYWRGSGDGAALQGRASPAHCWATIFPLLDRSPRPRRLLDLASGSGSLTSEVLRHLPEIECLGIDKSQSALREYRARHPGAIAALAELTRLPLGDQSQDLVASQFGLEYGGPAAVREAARTVANDGCLALVMHLRDGAIFQECADNLEVIESVQRARVLALASNAFAAGFDLNAGRGNVADFKAAEKQFVPAVRGLEQLLTSRGSAAAGGLVQRLYRDIAEMYRNMSSYDRDDVMAWIEGMEAELQAYAGRMAAMMECSLADTDFRLMCEQLAANEFRVERGESISLSPGGPKAAWVLVAYRRQV